MMTPLKGGLSLRFMHFFSGSSFLGSPLSENCSSLSFVQVSSEFCYQNSDTQFLFPMLCVNDTIQFEKI